MAKYYFLTATFLVLYFAVETFSQNVYHGTIVDVVDGKTVVLEMPNGRMNVVLQYVEVPEPEQPLHQIVIDHLEVLTSGKEADFRLVGLGTNDVRGRLVISGIDVSQQMLRDGAAWLIPREKSGQSTAEFESYNVSQDQARADKLGVWSVADLKPAWEFRADKEEKIRQLEAAKVRLRGVRSGLGPYQSNARPGELNNQKMAAFDKDSWFEWITAAGGESYGVHSYDDPKKQFRAFYTSNAVIDFSTGNSKQKLDCRAVYYSLNGPDGSHKDVYNLLFMALSDDYNFSRRASRLTIVADGRAISANLDRGLRGKESPGALEVLFYRLSRESLRKIADAHSVEIRIDSLTGHMSKDGQNLIGQLIAGN
ncbi:MAG TPA: thermonuclease family protein [Pyrinomonadaceae bacterium]